jgi:hypothetical protein
MTYPRDIKSLSALISLAVLAIGFTLLGLLALANQRNETVADATVLESNCCVIGSIVSIIAGAIFLLAGWIYWNRSAAIDRSQSSNEQGRVEKDSDVSQRPLTPDTLSPKVSILYRKKPLSQNALVQAEPNGNRTLSENTLMHPNLTMRTKAGVDA